MDKAGAWKASIFTNLGKPLKGNNVFVFGAIGARGLIEKWAGFCRQNSGRDSFPEDLMFEPAMVEAEQPLAVHLVDHLQDYRGGQGADQLCSAVGVPLD